jgi:hypothetical protein
MKRACQDCGKRIIAALAQKGICLACHVAEHGLIIDIRIFGKSTSTERSSVQNLWHIRSCDGFGFR